VPRRRLAVMKIFKEQTCRAGHAIGAKTAKRFRPSRKVPLHQVRGLGAMNAIEIVLDKKNPKPNSDLTKAIVRRCYDKGLILLTAGAFGNVIRHLVPLVVTDAQLEKGLQILDEAMAEKVE
jgi:4-aminobutyrate aminotransferase/(S)-3-amino-2-methylpropionate transaminase